MTLLLQVLMDRNPDSIMHHQAQFPCLTAAELQGVLFALNPKPMWIYDIRTLRFLAVNQAAINHYGYSNDQFLHMTIADIRPSEEVMALQEVLALKTCPLETHRTAHHQNQNGEQFWVEITSQEVDFEGSAGRLVTTHDITERRQAEQALVRAQEQYRSIFDNAVEGIFQTTTDGSYLSANPSLARIYGYESPEDLITHLDNIALGLYVDPTRRDTFTAVMLSEGIIVNFESQVRRKDGTIIWINESARAVQDAAGDILYYEGMVEDITERKALEAEREHLLADALYRANHDPLTGLLNHRTFHLQLEEQTVRAQCLDESYVIILLDLDNFEFYNDTYGHAAGDELLRRTAAVLSSTCRPGDYACRYGGDEFALMIGRAGGSEAAARLNDCLGVLNENGFKPPGHEYTIPLRFSVGLAVFPEDGLTRQDVLHTAGLRLLRVKSGSMDAPAAQLRETLTQTINGFSMLDALVTSVDTKDRYTRRHSEDVMAYCAAMAQEMDLEKEIMQSLQTAALLHDVGKIGVPDHILRKPGRLTEAEFAAVKHHPLMGAVIVGAVPGFEKTLDAIRHHHERWDGAGYPYGLKGMQTPLIARIMAVADAFSAMTMDRPYRQGMPAQKAMDILKAGAGAQWDPECVHTFLRSQQEPAKRRLMQAA